MQPDFYDPLVDKAGEIAQPYEISVSDVIGLLLMARRDEARVREALAESASSGEARAAHRDSRPFDLVAHARKLLQGSAR